MDHLRTVYQCRELSAAVLRLVGGEEALCGLNAALAGAAVPQQPEDDVSDQLAQVVTLVLKDLECPEYPFPTEPTEGGVDALRALQRAVFGSTESSLMHAVYCGTLAQAWRIQQLCVASLLAVLAPHNCLAIYCVAAGCNCEPLADAARRFALLHFSAATQLDYVGLSRLAPASLMGFLCSDELQVSCELEVFSALVTWTEFDPATRAPCFARRLAAAVRLPRCSISDLVFMDSHPLVGKDKKAVMLVAHAYLAQATGVVSTTPFGYHTSSRARRSCPSAEGPPAASSDSAAASGLPTELGPFLGGSPLGRRAQGSCSGAGLAELVQSLAVAPPPACGSAGPGTPTFAPAEQAQQAAAAAAAVGMGQEANAPTPALRAQSLSPAQPQQPAPAASRARDMHPAQGSGCSGLAARRSLFCASPSAKAAARPQSQQPAAQRTRPSEVELEMLLSPTKAGIREWLAGAEAAAPQPQFWGSKKRLRYD